MSAVKTACTESSAEGASPLLAAELVAALLNLPPVQFRRGRAGLAEYRPEQRANG